MTSSVESSVLKYFIAGVVCPIRVDGGWGQWTGWSQCGNGKDGKSVCRKKRVSFVNKPV